MPLLSREIPHWYNEYNDTNDHGGDDEDNDLDVDDVGNSDYNEDDFDNNYDKDFNILVE